LLDDAIREHLDLKRRRGADPTEIERAEREALGPVRRGPEEREPIESAADEVLAYDHEGEQEWHEEGSDHIPTGVVEPEPIDFGREPAAADPFEDEFGAEPADHESFEPPATEPDHLEFEQQPRRRGFLGRRKQQPSPPPEEDVAEPPLEDDPFLDSHATEPPPPASAEPPGGETVEYEVEAALEAEQQKPGEDVLEETPEFLQDTPDHDRLWFEQRPPRDFDFDG
jgi:hypothetical protein